MTIVRDPKGFIQCSINRPDQGSYLYFNEFAAGFTSGTRISPASVRVYVISCLEAIFRKGWHREY